ncbi:MAG TPA: hypothetical protein VFZ00_29925, partial [Solirubrobacter sp.]|nr:hypothetical protein [Solirubrobacter sp.]
TSAGRLQVPRLLTDRACHTYDSTGRHYGMIGAALLLGGTRDSLPAIDGTPRRAPPVLAAAADEQCVRARSQRLCVARARTRQGAGYH